MQEFRRPVLIVMPVLGSGGVSRRAIDYAAALRSRVPVEAVVFQKQRFLSDEWPSNVPLHSLGKRGRCDTPRLVCRLRRLIKDLRPRVVLSFIWYANVLTLLATALPPRPRVVICATMNTTVCLGKVTAGRLKRLAVRALYPHADCVVAVSHGLAGQLAHQFRVPPKRIQVIHNGVPANRLQVQLQHAVAWPWSDGRTPVVLAVGRLAPQKNYGLLLRAFSRVRRYVSAHLAILGEGPERGFLQALCGRLQIGPYVALPGFQANPMAWMMRSTMLVLSSDWEGCGNVLLEAMASGLPVVSTRCPFGPEEIIVDGVSGILTPCGDVETLTGAMVRLLRDPDLRRRLAESALSRMSRFSFEGMVQGYNRVLGVP